MKVKSKSIMFSRNNLLIAEYVHDSFKDVATIAKSYYNNRILRISFCFILFCFFWYMYTCIATTLLALGTSVYFNYSLSYCPLYLFMWLAMFSRWLLQRCNMVLSVFIVVIFGFVLYCILFVALFLRHQ